MGKKKVTKSTKATEPAASPAASIPRPRLHKLRISNFRCIGATPVEIELDDIVVLVGPNNAGKSSILRAYEIVMLHGSAQGELVLDDFPNGQVTAGRHPTIELETVVFEKTAPGDRWVRTDPASGEMFVREKWTWSKPGPPVKVGWDVASSDWDSSQGPWGAANVAQAFRAQPHRVDAFQHPDGQAAEVVKLLTKAITDRVKELSKKKADATGSELTEYEKLLGSIKQLRISIANDATTAVKNIQDDLAKMVSDVFPDYTVTFDARPEDDLEKALSLYKPDPLFKMGPSKGFHTTLDRQGSGACRTLIWAALRILSERSSDKGDGSDSRPHLLLMDEPEICLHPDAIREACRVLYDLPKTKNWQVMITTHSPVFIDLSRDNTSIVRVERTIQGDIHGTTIFRPAKAKLDVDDKAELKLLNACDPYVAEFFFGGQTVVVEGDTEFTAFRYIASIEPEKYKNIHVVRARGKACIKSLCKILNQFEKHYSVLHDSDREKIKIKKTGKEKTNPMWTENKTIADAVADARKTGKVRLIASVPNLEEAFFGKEADDEKPYNALTRLRTDQPSLARVRSLLDCLVDGSKPVPTGAIEWTTMDELSKAVLAVDSVTPSGD